LEEKLWKEQFKNKIEEQFEILEKSKIYKGTWMEIQELILNYFDKSKNADIYELMNVYGKPVDKNILPLVKMALFLWEYEGNFTFCINFLCFLLISNGHDLFDRKYVKAFEEIEKVGIYAKANFLVAHGFTMFDETENEDIKKFRELRNNIAHYNFRIEDDGVVKQKVKHSKKWEYVEVKVLPTHSQLLSYTNGIREILWSFVFV
jgi:hypothetical protein